MKLNEKFTIGISSLTILIQLITCYLILTR